MGLFDRLFARKSAAKTRPEPAPTSDIDADAGVDVEAEETRQEEIDPALAKALQAFKGGNLKRTLQLASARLDAGVDAYRLCALSLCGMNRYAEALPYWEKVFEHEPSAHNALQVATSTVMTGQVEAGEAWLEKFDQINHSSQEASPAGARTNFISALMQAGLGEYALPHLDWMRWAYTSLSITDTTFLYLRGVAPFSVFLELSLPLLRLRLSETEVVQWYQSMHEDLDADGQALLEAHIGQLQP